MIDWLIGGFVVVLILWTWFFLAHEVPRMRTYKKQFKVLKRADYVNPQYIYIIRGRGEFWSRYWKIGLTNDIKKRLSTHQTSISPKGVYVIGVYPTSDMVASENLVKVMFEAERRSNANEFFAVSPRLFLWMLAVRHNDLTKKWRKKFKHL